jgi:subtilisin family serine protease/subtilisin-like proprotein convertase family protein
MLSSIILLSLTGCGDDNKKQRVEITKKEIPQKAIVVVIKKVPPPKPITTKVKKDTPPQAYNYIIESPKQWLPTSGSLPAHDLDGDQLTITFSEKGKSILAEKGIYHFSHGHLTLTGNDFIYTPMSGQEGIINYTVTSNQKSASAQLIIKNVMGDPLANQQWHLYNQGKKSYALSEQMKAYYINDIISRGVEKKKAKKIVNEFFTEKESLLIAGEDINVIGAYAQNVTGKGMIAVVVDSGMEIRHEDLIDNILPNRSLNLIDTAINKTDPTSQANNGDHGTSVAGIIAAKAWNGLGGHGVAPDTKLIGMNYIQSKKIPQSNFIVHGFPGSGILPSENVVVFNRSYGYDQPISISYSTLNESIDAYPSTLRNKKGALSIKSSGNEFESSNRNGSVCNDNKANDLGLSCYNTSFYPSNNHPFYLSVAAINTNGHHSSYSTAGAGVFVSAPAGEEGEFYPAIITTDQMTCLNGYSSFNNKKISFFSESVAKKRFPFNYPGHQDNPRCNYTSTFNGTSASAPNVSGVVALIASANNELTWRDIRHILAKTSTKVDPNNKPIALNIDNKKFIAHDGWIKNAAGYSFNNLYGFGRVNAGEAVRMAKSYKNRLGEMQTSAWIGLGSVVGEPPLTQKIPDNNLKGTSFIIHVKEELELEAIQFKFDISNVDFIIPSKKNTTQSTAGMDLAIEVTSPSGTRAVLLTSKQTLIIPAVSFDIGYHHQYILKDNVILANAFYGEKTKGNWTIKILDTSAQTFTASDFGQKGSPLSHYVNNKFPSIVEGVALRTFAHTPQ